MNLKKDIKSDWVRFHREKMTFSIIGKRGKSLGVGVVSGSTAVRNRVPWVKRQVGAIATQAYTETMYGEKGLKLLEEGASPRSALHQLLQEDVQPQKRQVALLDNSGEQAMHTGSSCPKKRSAACGEDCIAIGNLLESRQTAPAMVKAFGRVGSLSKCILQALEAGANMGGDQRGNQTAALLIKGNENIDIGIDASKYPLKDLRRAYEKLIDH